MSEVPLCRCDVERQHGPASDFRDANAKLKRITIMKCANVKLKRITIMKCELAFYNNRVFKTKDVLNYKDIPIKMADVLPLHSRTRKVAFETISMNGVCAITQLHPSQNCEFHPQDSAKRSETHL